MKGTHLVLTALGLTPMCGTRTTESSLTAQHHPCQLCASSVSLQRPAGAPVLKPVTGGRAVLGAPGSVPHRTVLFTVTCGWSCDAGSFPALQWPPCLQIDSLVLIPRCSSASPPLQNLSKFLLLGRIRTLSNSPALDHAW